VTAFGIDFGTTNSVVAAYGPGGIEVLAVDDPPAEWAVLGFDRVLPSVFAIGDGGEPLFGWAAKRRRDRLEAVKRLFATEEVVEVGGQRFVVEEVAAMLFGHLARAASSSGLTLGRAVVTVPANSRGLARYRTRLCAAMAGLEVPALVNEPTAAAMAYSLGRVHDETIMVVDWGGGTLDVTVLEAVGGVFLEQASKGVQRLGGLDFDARFAQWLVETGGGAHGWSPADRATFRLDVERAKIQLSEREEAHVRFPDGRFRIVSRADLERVVRPLVERCRQPVEQCLADIGALAPDVDAVVLVGGTSRMPLVREFVRDLVGREPAPGVDPMHAVAQGAAVAAAILSGELDDHDFFVSTEHALGTVVLDGETDQPRFATLIPRNQKLPARASDTYFPVADFQSQIRIRVIEGDPAKPVDDDDNVVLRTWEVHLPEPRPAHQSAFEVTYAYDVDGILRVTVVDGQTGAQLLDDDVSFGFTRDKRALVEMAGRVERALDEDEVVAAELPAVDDDTAELLLRARTKVIPFLDEDQAVLLRRICVAVETSSGDDRQAARAQLETVLRKYTYLF
jgi:molecular chaperone DnaK (HSP70)